jgi:hypothetical protein
MNVRTASQVKLPNTASESRQSGYSEVADAVGESGDVDGVASPDTTYHSTK